MHRILQKVKTDTAKEDFNLEGPLASPLHDDVLMAHINKEFDRVTIEVQDAENKRLKQESLQVEKQRKKEEKFSKQDPARLIVDTIKGCVDNTLASKGNWEHLQDGMDTEAESENLDPEAAAEMRRKRKENEKKKEKHKKQQKKDNKNKIKK